MKWPHLIILFVLIIGLAFASGFRIHPENMSYYFQGEIVRHESEVRFKDGSKRRGMIMGQDSISMTLDQGGVVETFPAETVESIHSLPAGNFFKVLGRNYRLYSEKQPLVSFQKEKSFGAAVDSMIMEPSRIAETIKKKNGGEGPMSGAFTASRERAKALQAEVQMKKAQNEAMARRLDADS